jgi:hemoglobin-like flavoprotein
MTPKQITAVKASWEQLRPVWEQTAFLFYSRLFGQYPELRHLFRTDSREQGHRLMAMLDTAVASLDDFDSLSPDVQALGARHLSYGVADNHYALFEEALHWTLSQGLGTDFTPEVEAAWRALYARLAATMRSGAGAAG